MTRRKITSNIISNNIMNFNQPTVLQNFRDMELSSEYHTQVNSSRFRQHSSIHVPSINLGINTLPLESLLNEYSARQAASVRNGILPKIPDFVFNSM